MIPSESEANKALVLEAFDTLFNRRDYAAAERFWSPHYIQHSAHIAPCREGLFDLIRAAPAELQPYRRRGRREASYQPVHYIPPCDVDMAALTRTETRTYCPYKGEASYFNIPAGGERSADAVWSYEEPHESVAVIKDLVAFYSNRVDLIEERAD